MYRSARIAVLFSRAEPDNELSALPFAEEWADCFKEGARAEYGREALGHVHGYGNCRFALAKALCGRQPRMTGK